MSHWSFQVSDVRELLKVNPVSTKREEGYLYLQDPTTPLPTSIPWHPTPRQIWSEIIPPHFLRHPSCGTVQILALFCWHSVSFLPAYRHWFKHQQDSQSSLIILALDLSWQHFFLFLTTESNLYQVHWPCYHPPTTLHHLPCNFFKHSKALGHKSLNNPSFHLH